MVNIYDMREYIKKHPETGISVNQDDLVVNKEGKILATLEEFTQEYRKIDHCDFECIFSDHVSLFVLFRCKECGTVIFSYEDERYDPKLKCPNCGDYETYFAYYTKEEIESNPNVKQEIDMYIRQHEEDIKFDERYKRRGGKYDWQLGSKNIKFKKFGVSLNLECDNVCDSHIKGLRLIVYPLHPDGSSWIYGKKIHIPLSISDWRHQIKLKKYMREHPDECFG